MLRADRWLIASLSAYLSAERPGYQRHDTITVENLARVIRRGDVLLVEGNSRISEAIKYLTQSSWSHAALFVGAAGDADPVTAPSLLEADLQEGVRQIPLQHYRNSNLRICRPVAISEAEVERLVVFAMEKLGHRYDLRNVFDLARYLIQRPVVPNRLRRAMIGFGSGEPTRVICSTMIAESFQHIDYPILPIRVISGSHDESIGEHGDVPVSYQRHFTHFTPRDFDLSPYFKVVKPTLELGFDYRAQASETRSD
jgi:hypothetical protein